MAGNVGEKEEGVGVVEYGRNIKIHSLCLV